MRLKPLGAWGMQWMSPLDINIQTVGGLTHHLNSLSQWCIANQPKKEHHKPSFNQFGMFFLIRFIANICWMLQILMRAVGPGDVSKGYELPDKKKHRCPMCAQPKKFSTNRKPISCAKWFSWNFDHPEGESFKNFGKETHLHGNLPKVPPYSHGNWVVVEAPNPYLRILQIANKKIQKGYPQNIAYCRWGHDWGLGESFYNQFSTGSGAC